MTVCLIDTVIYEGYIEVNSVIALGVITAVKLCVPSVKENIIKKTVIFSKILKNLSNVIRYVMKLRE